MKNPAGTGEKLARWAAAALWFAFILSLSQEPFASSHTEGWLTQFFASLGIDVGPVAGILNLIVRKCAHFVEYAVFGGLLYRAAQRTWPGGSAGAVALLLAVLGAACDELGQTQVVGRTPAFKDVVLDSCGGAGGVWIAMRAHASGLWGRQRRRKRG